MLRHCGPAVAGIITSLDCGRPFVAAEEEEDGDKEERDTGDAADYAADDFRDFRDVGGEWACGRGGEGFGCGGGVRGDGREAGGGER